MANQLVVCLVSEQTIPNVQFLKWCSTLKKDDDKVDLLLVSTDKMEMSKVSDKILNATEKFQYSFEIPYVISVQQNDAAGIRAEFDNFFQQYRYDRIVANITGGTKIMSLTAYLYITEMKDSVVYYKPIDGDMIELFPESKTISCDVNLSFDEYLAALGFEYEKKHSKSFRNYDFNRKLYKNCLKANGKGLRVFTALNVKNEDGTFNLRKMNKNPQGCSPADFSFADAIVRYFGMDPEKLTADFLTYIKGGWLEELVYQHIKNKFKIPNNQIACNVKTVNGEVHNEFDVMYLYNDVLHVVECKVFLQDKNPPKKIDDALYKLKALALGLASKRHLYTTAKIQPLMRARAEDFNIDLVCVDMLENL